MTTVAEKPLLSVREAATFLGVPYSTFTNWIYAGRIHKVPGTNRITRLELERFLEEHSRPRTPEQRRRGRYGG